MHPRTSADGVDPASVGIDPVSWALSVRRTGRPVCRSAQTVHAISVSENRSAAVPFTFSPPAAGDAAFARADRVDRVEMLRSTVKSALTNFVAEPVTVARQPVVPVAT